jgi:hypothetical protein
MKPSCSVPAALGRTVCFRADRDGSVRLVIVKDGEGTCMSATLDSASANVLAATITAALNLGTQFTLDLPE